MFLKVQQTWMIDQFVLSQIVEVCQEVLRSSKRLVYIAIYADINELGKGQLRSTLLLHEIARAETQSFLGDNGYFLSNRNDSLSNPISWCRLVRYF